MKTCILSLVRQYDTVIVARQCSYDLFHTFFVLFLENCVFLRNVRTIVVFFRLLLHDYTCGCHTDREKTQMDVKYYI
jgi:hypothetical protein